MQGMPLGIAPLPPMPGCTPGEKAYRHVAFVHINKVRRPTLSNMSHPPCPHAPPNTLRTPHSRTQAGGTAMRAILFKYAAHQMLERTTPDAHIKMSRLGSRFFHASASLQRQVDRLTCD